MEQLESQSIAPENWYACWAPNRDALIHCIYDTVSKFNPPPDPEATFLSLVCRCGKVHNFEREWDVPYDDVICDCGCYIIHYHDPII